MSPAERNAARAIEACAAAGGLVNASGIARRFGVSREAVRMWSALDGFPEGIAVNEGDNVSMTVWCMDEVRAWWVAKPKEGMRSPAVKMDKAEFMKSLDEIDAERAH